MTKRRPWIVAYTGPQTLGPDSRGLGDWACRVSPFPEPRSPRLSRGRHEEGTEGPQGLREAPDQQAPSPKGPQTQGPSSSSMAMMLALFMADGKAGSCRHSETHRRLGAFPINVTRRL